jgi:hypothetical protein
MNHRSNAGHSKRVLVSLLATACLVVGSPAVANAASGGAQKPVSATHGDCKNDNAGLHKGYVCPSDVPSGTDVGTGTGTGAGGNVGGGIML